MRTVNISERLSRVHEQWHGYVIAEVNDMYVKVAKLLGSFEWHSHEWEDEMFQVVAGELTIRFRDGGREWEAVAGPGEFIVVPHGIEHMPVAENEVEILLFEPKATVNTGGNASERTVEPEWLK